MGLSTDPLEALKKVRPLPRVLNGWIAWTPAPAFAGIRNAHTQPGALIPARIRDAHRLQHVCADEDAHISTRAMPPFPWAAAVLDGKTGAEPVKSLLFTLHDALVGTGSTSGQGFITSCANAK